MKKISIFLSGMFVVFMISCKDSHQHNNENPRAQSEEHIQNHDEKQEEHANGESHSHEHETAGEEHDHSNDHTSPGEHQHEGATHDHDAESIDPEDEKTSSDGHVHEHEEAAHTEYVVETLRPTTFHEVVKTSGKLTTLPKNQSKLVAPVSGVVEFVDNSVLAGKKVRRGQLLLRISNASIAEDNVLVQFEKAKARYEQKQEDFKRARKLIKEEIISEKEYLQHRSEYREQKARFEALKKHIDKGFGTVKSDQNGYIREVLVKEGSHVQAGQALAVVENKERLLLKAEISQKYASRIHSFTSAHFETPDGSVYNTSDLNGTMVASGKSLVSESFYLPVYFELDNSKQMIPGSFVHVFLIGEPRKQVLVLPKDAFIEEQGNYFVFVETGEGFQKRAVGIGADDGKRILVKQGLQAGERVVTHGAYHVKMMQTSSAVPSHGHSH